MTSTSWSMQKPLRLPLASGSMSLKSTAVCFHRNFSTIADSVAKTLNIILRLSFLRLDGRGRLNSSF